MTVSRNQLIAAAVVVVLLLGTANYFGRLSSSGPTRSDATASMPPLPMGDVTGLSRDAQMQVTGLSVSAMMFVFLHEAGHMLISELKLPAIGPQEDVADEFATFVLTSALTEAPEDQKGAIADLVYSGALFWKLAAAERANAGGKIAWYDEHSPDERRYYNILCLATGADPLRFVGRAVKDGVPQSRLNRCAEEYKTKYAAWDVLMAPHEPGWFERTFGGRELTIEYGPAVSGTFGAFENVYRQGTVFQPFLASVSRAVSLPNDIPVVVRGCGEVNAWWSPSEKKITLCHDLFASVTQSFARAMAAAASAQGQGQGQQAPQGGGGGGQTPPAPPAPPAPPQGATALAGVWQCDGAPGGMVVQQRITLQPNATFQAHIMANGMNMSAWGRWSVSSNVLRFDYEGPPGTPSPEFVTFQMPSAGVMHTQNGTCRKVQ